MAEQIYNGTTITVTAGATVARGDLIQVKDNFYGVAQGEATSGGKVALETQGVFGLTATEAISAGAAVYVNSSGAAYVTSGASGTCIGTAIEAATSGGIVKVILNR